jgi:hypothetical protein
MRGQATQSLYFSQIVDFFNTVEMILHALNRNVLACLNTLRFEDLTEGAFTFFGDESVF